MKVLWLCNFMLPIAAEQLHREATNKEGWLSGLAGEVLRRQGENDITLAVAFPVPEELLPGKEELFNRVLCTSEGKLHCYGFYEDTCRPERYDPALEERMRKITEDFRPDVVHCFGTEYPHTLAMCRSFPEKERLLVGIQGLCSVYAHAYFADLPEKTVHSVTLRDWLKQDSLVQQQEKFFRRGEMEKEAIRLAGNVTGRTRWDRHYTARYHPEAAYYCMNETLRRDFYGCLWQEEKCIPHSIFLSQGDYPIKGLHYLLEALPAVREKYPDVKVFVAGGSPVRDGGLTERLKQSAYGRYLRKKLKQYRLEGQVEFVGRLDASEMKARYLKSSLFVCCSSIENSPNSLGEAMLLGMPCVSADVGGISSIFQGGQDGILYQGFRTGENTENSGCYLMKSKEGQLEMISKRLSDGILAMWSDREKMREYCKNARNHAIKTHDGERNYKKMIEIYASISAKHAVDAME